MLLQDQVRLSFAAGIPGVGRLQPGCCCGWFGGQYSARASGRLVRWGDSSGRTVANGVSDVGQTGPLEQTWVTSLSAVGACTGISETQEYLSGSWLDWWG